MWMGIGEGDGGGENQHGVAVVSGGLVMALV